MKPYYKSWKESAHNQTNCLKCHYKPGLRGLVVGKFKASARVGTYITKTYGPKPDAQVSDASCLQAGCHSKEKLFEEEVPFEKEIAPFSHLQHLGGLNQDIKLRCTSCHSHVLKGEHFSVEKSVCFTCHFDKGAKEEAETSCRSCHKLPQEKIVRQGIEIEHTQFLKYGAACESCHAEVTRGKGEVSEARCLSCHDQTGEKFRDPEFLHDTHVTERKVECFECHAEIKHGITKATGRLNPECKSCHTSQHSPQEQMYEGIGGKGVPDSPGPMFAAQVYCKGCHLPDKTSTPPVLNARLARAKGEACVKCHGEGYDQVLLSWQSMLGETISAVKVLKGQVGQLLGEKGSLSEEELNQVKKLYKEAEYNLEFVERGRGEHNLDYADSLLSKARDNFEKSLKILKKSREVNSQ